MAAYLDAVAQGALVAKGEVTPLELAEAAIARIEAVNPKINAVTDKDYDRARARAKGPLPKSALSGVPYLLKDIENYAGMNATMGSRLLATNMVQETAPVPQCAIDAGMVVLGKTNTPEFGLLGTTEGLLLGACHNPWNLEHSPGGSSGGSAAAVAAGIVPVANASDGGGSIRIPASCCGLFGLKASRGRMHIGPTPLAADIVSVTSVSRTVRDGAMIFALSEAKGEHAKYPTMGYVSGPSGKRLRIAFHTTKADGTEPHPDVKAAVEASARLCAELGHEVVPVKNPIAGDEFITQFLTVWASSPADIVKMAQEGGLKPEEVLEPWTIGLADLFNKMPKDALAKALAYFDRVERQVADFMAGYDVWLTPVLAAPPPKLGEQAPTVAFDTLYQRTVDYVAYTPVHNVAGTPAMSVPLGMSSNSLPIGSQFAAAKGNEAMLLALAYELEQAAPWIDRHPPTYVG
ncbi:MAG: amidase [Parvibaculum sp.]|uniref:amidase n=1 Tax=Parvibaculum sp. TaxID=2024848 RepID=UPI0025CC5B5A|nr:amidase [Parvibaculum sp.]MCE9650650.1 amidase [Parvibaculum sp.]